jgi:outer membrane protein assembly factor BamB
VPSLRTTISCRLIAPFVVASTLIAAAGDARVSRLEAGGEQSPPARSQPASVPRLPTTLRWKAPLAAPPAGSPVVAGGQVVVALQNGAVAAFRASDGAESWKVELATDQPLAVQDDVVLVASGEAVHALRLSDGTVAWRAPSGSLAAPLLAHEGWVVAATAAELIAVRGKDGSIVWRRAIDPLVDRPAIEGDRLYLPLAGDRVRALDLATGADRWTRRLGGAPTEVLAFADRVYVGSADKHLYCLDALDGSIHWRFRVGAAVRGRPASDGERVLAGALDNLVNAFDRMNGARRWNEGVPFRPTAGPLVVGTTVVVSGPASELPVFDTVTGARRPRVALGANLAAPVAVGMDGDEVVMAAVSGSIATSWSLALFDASYAVTLAPLTALPGEVIPISPPKG